METWENNALSAIFRVTLDSSRHQDHLGHRLYYLADLRLDLEEQNEPVRLRAPVLDHAILEAAPNLGKTTPLDYLLACWKRVSKQFKLLKSRPGHPKLAIIKEARRLCMSYCIFAVTMPNMFGYACVYNVGSFF